MSIARRKRKLPYVRLKKKKLRRKVKREKLTDEEYELILKLKKEPGERRLAIVKACLVRKRHLAPSDLLSEAADQTGREKVPRGLRRVERTNDVKALASKTIVMVLPLVFVPELLLNYEGVKTIFSMLFKVLSILSTAYSGNYQGETLYTVDAVENYELQINLLTQLEKWREKRVKQEEKTTS